MLIIKSLRNDKHLCWAPKPTLVNPKLTLGADEVWSYSKAYVGVIWGLYRDNGKEHGNYYII